MKSIVSVLGWIAVFPMVTNSLASSDAGDISKAKALARTENVFAIDLYKALKDGEGNLFFSPYSLATALSMTWAGARGETAAEFTRALHLVDLPGWAAGDPTAVPPSVFESFAALQQRINASADGVFELHTANALWGMNGFPFSEDYVSRIRESFGGNLESVDFGDEPAARKRINAWVVEQTQNRIPELIPQGVLTGLTRLVLTNAIYFKADWAEPFPKKMTASEVFHKSKTSDVRVDMMRHTVRCNLARLQGFRMISLPYRGGVSMLVVLPDKIDGLRNIETLLTSEQLDEWVAQLGPAQVRLSLPRFRNVSSFECSEKLKGLGIRQAFQSGEANFSGISPKGDLYISAVIHKSFVAVDEAGTEAAAATAVALLGAAAPNPEEPIEFTADHPFLYLIRDNQSGAILFLGRMVDPTEKGE